MSAPGHGESESLLLTGAGGPTQNLSSMWEKNSVEYAYSLPNWGVSTSHWGRRPDEKPQFNVGENNSV